jgi:hypothetical protein
LAMQPGGETPPATPEPRRTGRGMARKVLVALGLVLVIQCLFALCLVSANQLLFPHEMPFGVVDSSPVVGAVVAKEPGALDVIAYPSKSAALHAIDRARSTALMSRAAPATR